MPTYAISVTYSYSALLNSFKSSNFYVISVPGIRFDLNTGNPSCGQTAVECRQRVTYSGEQWPRRSRVYRLADSASRRRAIDTTTPEVGVGWRHVVASRERVREGSVRDETTCIDRRVTGRVTDRRSNPPTDGI